MKMDVLPAAIDALPDPRFRGANDDRLFVRAEALHQPHASDHRGVAPSIRTCGEAIVVLRCVELTPRSK